MSACLKPTTLYRFMKNPVELFYCVMANMMDSKEARSGIFSIQGFFQNVTIFYFIFDPLVLDPNYHAPLPSSVNKLVCSSELIFKIFIPYLIRFNCQPIFASSETEDSSQPVSFVTESWTKVTFVLKIKAIFIPEKEFTPLHNGLAFQNSHMKV